MHACMHTYVHACMHLYRCVLLLYSIAEKYKLIQQADTTDPYPFSRRVFTGWDYAVTYADTARRKAMHIATELKV